MMNFCLAITHRWYKWEMLTRSEANNDSDDDC